MGGCEGGCERDWWVVEVEGERAWAGGVGVRLRAERGGGWLYSHRKKTKVTGLAEVAAVF